ncbi:hypothetical protein ABS315_18725 [Peribacillus frigoritolerans]|uniref:hypothetical protein n=1 Tax=Peribacillus frigoritolerans TaxID=450367 RepID=UPI0034E0C460
MFLSISTFFNKRFSLVSIPFLNCGCPSFRAKINWLSIYVPFLNRLVSDKLLGSEAVGPKGPQGTQGPQEPQGSGSQYFFNQTTVALPIVSIGVFVPVIQLAVTTTFLGERVRVDSIISLNISVGNASTYSYNYTFSILRAPATELMRVTFTETNMEKVGGVGSAIADVLNFTWTNIPPLESSK